MSLIRQLRDDAVDSTKHLPDLLRRAIVLASLLRNDDLRAWAKRELDGYESFDGLPEYRELDYLVYGHFLGPYRQADSVQIPLLTLSLSPKLEEILTGPLKVSNGLASLESMLEEDSSTLKFSFPTEVALLLPPVVEGCQCVSLWRQVHKSQVRQILDSIRSRLLEIVLDLAERFPEITESEKAVESVDKTAAAAIIHNHIFGNGNVVASGARVEQSVTQVAQPNDVDSLLLHLKTLNLSEDEKAELRDAIGEDGKPKEKKLGPKVAGWIGRMTQKLLESGMTAAPGLLTEGVSRYYGWK